MTNLRSRSNLLTQEPERHALVKQLQRKARKLKRLVYCGIVLTIVDVEVLALCCWVLSGTTILPYVGSFLVMSLFFLGICLGITLLWDETGEQAIKLRDKRLVGTLLDMLELDKLGMSARTPLLHLLPTLKSEDADLLNQEQRLQLNGVLMSRDIPLIVVSLNAMERVGDQQALWFVQRLASGVGNSAKSKQVRDAAQHCLPLLQKRVAQHEASRTLLRPTQAESTSERTLLRAAESSEPTAARELLRADLSKEN